MMYLATISLITYINTHTKAYQNPKYWDIFCCTKEVVFVQKYVLSGSDVAGNFFTFPPLLLERFREVEKIIRYIISDSDLCQLNKELFTSCKASSLFLKRCNRAAIRTFQL